MCSSDLEQDSPKTRKAVLDRINRELSYTERKHPFGTVISYGQLFTALENTEGVKKVLELNPVSYTHLDVYKRQAVRKKRFRSEVI